MKHTKLIIFLCIASLCFNCQRNAKEKDDTALITDTILTIKADGTVLDTTFVAKDGHIVYKGHLSNCKIDISEDNRTEEEIMQELKEKYGITYKY